MFSGRTAFIIAAIGSAVGLGNIWRFPYVAYTNGGGAFVIPYLVALLTAGIPLLFLDYAIGHRFRGSPPMAMRRMARRSEWIGWWHVLINFVIASYYAVILAWSVSYMALSFTKGWGEDPATYFFGDYLQTAEEVTVGFDFVPQVVTPLLLLWVGLLVVLALGVQRGIARASAIVMPLLVAMFLLLVGIALTLPGALDGLQAFFQPNWEALADSKVWIAAYGQIFFSLSVGFGIMITYASYLRRKTDLTGSGFVVGFANSSFEVLAGIGVFAALGFMAGVAGSAVGDVATNGIGLAFIAFPTIINEAPLGQLIGVLFFGSLVFAGFTSMISILEVIISAVQDKLGWSRQGAVWAVGTLTGGASLLLYPTTTGINLLDVTDNFVNNFGIVGAALTLVITVAFVSRKLPELRDHLSSVSSIKVGRLWMALVAVVTPVMLTILLVTEFITRMREGYGGMPDGFVATWGWGMSAGLIVGAIILSLAPWREKSAIHHQEDHSAEGTGDAGAASGIEDSRTAPEGGQA